MREFLQVRELKVNSDSGKRAKQVIEKIVRISFFSDTGSARLTKKSLERSKNVVRKNPTRNSQCTFLLLKFIVFFLLHLT